MPKNSATKCSCGQNLRAVFCFLGTNAGRKMIDGYMTCPKCSKIYKIVINEV